MGRGNDAIPTWSGFNFQGKVMLLHILKKINFILKNNDNIANYEVQLEREEDFVFIHKSIMIEFYQVKATLSKIKIKDYEVAIEKLIAHRDKNNSSGKGYLVAGQKIENLEEYTGNITILTYDLQKICEDIQDEIVIFYNNISFSNFDKVIAYGNLCLLVDEYVASMHKQSSANRQYNIPLTKFKNSLKESSIKKEMDNRFYLKEQAYIHLTKVIPAALESHCKYCNQHNKNNTYECDKCGAKKANDLMLKLTDLESYCRVLYPQRIHDWDELKFVELFTEEKIKQELLTIFENNTDLTSIYNEQEIILFKSDFSNAKKKEIIPTLLDLSDGNRNEEALQDIFSNIIHNQKINDIINSRTITAIPGNYMLGTLNQNRISSAWRKCNDEKINRYHSDIEIMSSYELIEKLREKEKVCEK